MGSTIQNKSTALKYELGLSIDALSLTFSLVLLHTIQKGGT